MKYCKGCYQNLSLEKFGLDKHKSDGKSTRCSNCIRKRVSISKTLKEWKKA